MRIILVRHGQTEWNDKEIFRGRADIPLDEVGKAQAQALGEKFGSYQISAIYTSPLRRSVETAQAIANKLNLVPQINEDLIEFDCGVWQGSPLTKVKKDFPGLYKQWIEEPEKAIIPNAETLAQVRIRVNKFVEKISDLKSNLAGAPRL